MKLHYLLRALVASSLLIGAAWAAGDEPEKDGEIPAKVDPPKSDSRIFGIIPNRRSTSIRAGEAEPLDAKGKFKLATQGAFDPGTFVTSAVYAGIGQATNQYPSFDQGLKGYGRRYGYTVLDTVSTTYWTDAIMPTIFRQDPRYYRLGEGSTGKRVKYSISRIWLARSDRGHQTFNFGEVFGNTAQAVVSNYYYPAAERNGGNLFARATLSIAPDVVSNLLREFWPDISRRMQQKRNKKTP